MSDAHNNNFEVEQSSMLSLISAAFRHTSFPWLNSKNVKKPQTLMKKLCALFLGRSAQEKLLETDCAWTMREKFHEIIATTVEHNNINQTWTWYDNINERPTPGDDEEDPLDMTDGPMQLHKDETVGNQGTRLQSYVKLREINQKKMERIMALAMSEGLRLGFGKRAVPQVLDSLKQLLDASTPSAQTVRN